MSTALKRLNRICFAIPLPPRTKKNSQNIVVAGGRPRIIPSKAYTEYELNAGYYIPCKWQHIDYPVNIKATFYCDTRRKVDLPNLLNALDDVLVHYGVVKDDNRNIIASHDGSRVLWDKNNPRTEVEITTLDEYYQKWGKS